MKKIILFAISLFCFGFSACAPASPPYGLSTLEGNWQRILSTDSHSDSLIVIVVQDSAIITYAPNNSHFFVNQKKWTNLTPIAEEGHFELYDLSKDGNQWKAIITMESKTMLKIKNKEFPNAPGSVQTWVKI